MKSSEPRRKASAKSETAKKTNGDGADRIECIAIAAYYRAEARGFAPGQAMDDWLMAEAEVDRGAAC